ncbi:sodium:alanine symporter family protein [uncultured Mailhella sp.]|uniref:alanine/glycine:cation symporter family protein n=1 Tax=uncultured Mailhella sp. TaxID=1981031 RepID=UPI0025CF932D|nr:sodium:alanine symporter family protein [uncultured Mailhella sp.]
MEFIAQVVDAVNSVLWGWLLLFLLCGTGIFYTIRLRFIQLRKFPLAFRRLFSNISLNGESADHTGMSSFQALATAVAAQVGTGNIAGAATAIAAGGPGAIFWMWLSAFFGMATNYAEAVLAQKYKSTNERGETVGGPAYYIRAAFTGSFGRALAAFFSVAIILALGFMGNMVQSNSIGAAFGTAFGVSPVLVGIIVALISAAIFLGGAKRIAWVMEKLVPLMALLYVGGCLIIIFANISALPGAFKTIFVMAFDPQSAGGGALGITVREAMRYGVARGLFSNEAGMGSTPHAHALAKVAHPDDQGMMAMMGVFIDTFVVLTCTALVIVITGVWNSGSTGTELAQIAFDTVFGSLGNIYIAICLFFFAFSTIIGWYFFGEANVKALFGAKYVKIYSAIVVLFIVLGSGLKVNLVWNMSDMFNGLMVLPNLVGLLALSGVVVAIARSRK